MAVPNLGDLVVSTARRWIPTLADNVTNNNALLMRLKSKGQIKKGNGGRSIVETLIYGTNSSIQFYQDYDVFTPPTTSQAVLDGAEFLWKQLGGFISWTGKEERMNTGEEERFDIVKTRLKQMQANLNNTLSTSIFSDGTAGAGKELTGLKAAIPDDPTVAGTYGGIDQVANSFWRSKTSGTLAAVTSTNVQGFLNTQYIATIRPPDRPDLFVMDSVWFSAYWGSLQAIQRITNDTLGEAGFMNLKYMDADCVYDPGTQAKRMYMLDTDSLFLRTSSDRSLGFDVGEQRTIQNADYKVVPIFFMGNITCNRRASNAILISG